MSASRVAIVQDYVPKFRMAFFSGLVDRLSKTGIEIVIVAGSPTGAQAARGDAAGSIAWQTRVEPRRINFRPIAGPFYGTARNWQDCDGVIFPLRGNSIDLNVELLRKPFTHRRIGAWGHVGAYIKDANHLDLAIERHQMRACDHVFAYTLSGARLAIEAGVDTGKVTAVMNSTDVSETLANFESMEIAIIKEFEQRHNLTRGKTFGYIGGVDAAKRISFLVDTLDVLWERDPQFRLVVGGRGDQERLLTSAADRGQVVRLGHAGPYEKALIRHVAEAVLNPGRIGLIAVECMAMGMPILTTDWAYHAPEYEYLVNNKDVFVSAGGPEQFANLVIGHTSSGDGDRSISSSVYPTLHGMVCNFADGVTKMMS